MHGGNQRDDEWNPYTHQMSMLPPGGTHVPNWLEGQTWILFLISLFSPCQIGLSSTANNRTTGSSKRKPKVNSPRLLQWLHHIESRLLLLYAPSLMLGFHHQGNFKYFIITT